MSVEDTDGLLRTIVGLLIEIRDAVQVERLAYTPKEVGKSIGVPYETVLTFIHNGRLRAADHPGYRGYLVSRQALDEFLNPLEPPAAA